MSHTVVLRGSLTPAAGVLERNEVKTFEYSDRVQGWIDKGYVVLVEETIELPAEEEVEAVLDESSGPLDRDEGEPSASASKADWVAFLKSKDVDFPEDAGRDVLRDGYQALKAQRAGEQAGE